VVVKRTFLDSQRGVQAGGHEPGTKKNIKLEAELNPSGNTNQGECETKHKRKRSHPRKRDKKRRTSAHCIGTKPQPWGEKRKGKNGGSLNAEGLTGK